MTTTLDRRLIDFLGDELAWMLDEDAAIARYAKINGTPTRFIDLTTAKYMTKTVAANHVVTAALEGIAA